MLVNRLGHINELMTANNYTSRVSPVFFLPDCNPLTDFLRSKFCEIVYASSSALSWSVAHLPPYGLAHGQNLVKFATNRVQTLRNAYI